MRLQDTPEEAPPHDAEIQEIDNAPKKLCLLLFLAKSVFIGWHNLSV